MDDQIHQSGDQVSRVEDNIVQTINLAGIIIILIQESIIFLYRNHIKSQKLRQSLGYWQNMALDQNGRYRILSIPGENFVNYLVAIDDVIPLLLQADAYPNPKPNSWSRLLWRDFLLQQNTSPKPDLPSPDTVCWVHLLFALGIKPPDNQLAEIARNRMEQKMVHWQLSTDGRINTQNNTIEIIYNGSVLCYIINLYSKPIDCSP